MKKSLLLAALLLPCAAQAETWVCEPKVSIFQINGGSIQIDNGDEYITIYEQSSEFSPDFGEGIPLARRIVIDTDKGVRVIDRFSPENYEGNCEEMENGFRCVKGSDFAEQTIWVVSTDTDIYSEAFVGPTLIQSYTGTCVRI